MKLFAAAAVTLAIAVGVSSIHIAQPVQARQTGGAAKGETLFKQRCAMCHAVGGTGGKLGPDLAKVVGRKAGSTAYSYSTAMKGSNTVWNARTLDAYLAAPTKAMPGTKMVISVAKPEDRAALISYLATTGK